MNNLSKVNNRLQQTKYKQKIRGENAVLTPYKTYNSLNYLSLSFESFISKIKATISPRPPNSRTDAPYTALRIS